MAVATADDVVVVVVVVVHEMMVVADQLHHMVIQDLHVGNIGTDAEIRQGIVVHTGGHLAIVIVQPVPQPLSH